MRLTLLSFCLVAGMSLTAFGAPTPEPSKPGPVPTPVTVTVPVPTTAPVPVPTPRTSFEASNPPVTPDATYPQDFWSVKWPHITVQEAERLWKTRKALFVDARSKQEWEQGHLPGAISLPVGDFDKAYDENVKKIKKAKVLITYCHGTGCHLADKCADKLVQKGHKNVASFFGGWPHWNQAGLPVENGQGEVLPTPVPTAEPSPATAPSPASATAK